MAAAPLPSPAPDALEHLRQTEFPDLGEGVYFNNASIGPVPARAQRAIDAVEWKRRAPERFSDVGLMRILADARAAAAALIGAGPDEIGLATNTSFGLNQAALALPLEPGDVVVLPDGEFPANVYPWLRLEHRGVRVERVPPAASGWPDEARLLERAADPAVRVVAVSFVQFSNGYRVDLDALSAVCRDHDTFLVVDAIQGLGAVPLDVRRTPVDILSCGAQKWLLSPWGSGFFYVRRPLIARLEPATGGWMAFAGTDDFSRLTDYDPRLLPDARRFEMVTLPFQDLAGMTASLEVIADMRPARVLDHVRALRTPLEDAAAEGAFAIASPVDERHDSGIIAIRPPDPAGAHRRLRDAGVTCALREGVIRLSPHGYNTAGEMDRVVEVLTAS